MLPINEFATQLAKLREADTPTPLRPNLGLQWTLTREFTYLDGRADGRCICMTRVLGSGKAVGEFLHNCTVLTQIDVTADAMGRAVVGCRCCDTCSPGPCLPP